jgi:hypothetical protein
MPRQLDGDRQEEDDPQESQHLFSAAWPGPGDSEGPVDPEAGTLPGTVRTSAESVTLLPAQVELLATAPWPGPGDSEGPVANEPGIR